MSFIAVKVSCSRDVRLLLETRFKRSAGESGA